MNRREWLGLAGLGLGAGFAGLIGDKLSKAVGAVLKLSRLEKVESEVPVGSIMPYGADAPAPRAWLVPQGQTLSKRDYPELYEAIGDAYGPSVDPEGFRLPTSLFRSSATTWSLVDAAGRAYERDLDSHQHGVGLNGDSTDSLSIGYPDHHALTGRDEIPVLSRVQYLMFTGRAS